MKKIRLFGVLLVSAMLTFTYPAIAQDNDNDKDRTEERKDDDDNDDDDGDSGKAGLIGLLGLLGLLGLRRRDDDHRGRDRDRVVRP